MEYINIQEVLSDERRREFITSSLQDSMIRLGFSTSLINDLIGNVDQLDIEIFIQKHKEELHRIENIHFFEELVPRYFNNYIVPEVPAGSKLFDLGCGKGTLIKELIKRGENKEIVGIDIKKSPEWDELINDKVRMEVVLEEDFPIVLEREQPDTVTATLAFHHMEYEQQKRYISSLYKALKPEAILVVLEDSYSETLPPERGVERYNGFMKWSKEDKHKIMGVLDWIANRILSMRTTMPVPFSYRTLEDWKSIFEEIGFTTLKTRFLGFPDDRDINNPQSVLVLKK